MLFIRFRITIHIHFILHSIGLSCLSTYTFYFCTIKNINIQPKIVYIKKKKKKYLCAFACVLCTTWHGLLFCAPAAQNLQSSNDSAEDSDVVEYEPLENGSFDLSKYTSLLQGGTFHSLKHFSHHYLFLLIQKIKNNH